MKTPDQLTQQEYRGRGYHVIKVESWGFHPKMHRTDFLGIYDYLAFNDAGEMIAIQTTTRAHASDRRKKMLRSNSFAWWTVGGRRSLLSTWYKERGRWKLQEEELTLENWQRYQDEEKERNSKIDTSRPLFKELFPDGLPAERQSDVSSV